MFTIQRKEESGLKAALKVAKEQRRRLDEFDGKNSKMFASIDASQSQVAEIDSQLDTLRHRLVEAKKGNATTAAGEDLRAQISELTDTKSNAEIRLAVIQPEIRTCDELINKLAAGANSGKLEALERRLEEFKSQKATFEDRMKALGYDPSEQTKLFVSTHLSMHTATTCVDAHRHILKCACRKRWRYCQAKNCG